MKQIRGAKTNKVESAIKGLIPLMDAAKKSGITRQAILKRVHEGSIKSVRLGRAFFVYEDEIERLRKHVQQRRQFQKW